MSPFDRPANSPASFRDLAAPGSARKHLVAGLHFRARSFDLEVTRWAPTRLTSSIFHSGHTEPYEPFDRPANSPAHPSVTSPRRDRPASLRCAGLHFRSQKLGLEVTRRRRPDLPPLSFIQAPRRAPAHRLWSLAPHSYLAPRRQAAARRRGGLRAARGGARAVLALHLRRGRRNSGQGIAPGSRQGQRTAPVQRRVAVSEGKQRGCH